MAVEAQYHRLFSPQLNRSRESLNAMENPAWPYGGVMEVDGAGSLAPAYSAIVPTATTNESGAAGGGGMAANINNNNNNSNNSYVSKKRPKISFLGEDVSSQIYEHMLDVDRLIVQHVMNARTELLQKRKRFSSQIIAALNESVSRQLKSKDEEMEQLRKLNWAMEERIKSLNIENNAWRYLASTHEAAAATLRANLDQVAAADDAESCCGDNFCHDERQVRDWKRMCRSCGNGEPSVLLLPCRHLCLCSACAPATDSCPICKCRKDGSVNVNLS